MAVQDLASGRRHQLYEFELLLAREMDGSVDLDQLTTRAQRFVPGVTRDQVEKFVAQFAALGLIANLPVDSKVGPRPQPPPVPGSGVDYGTFRQSLLRELGEKRGQRLGSAAAAEAAGGAGGPPSPFDEAPTAVADPFHAGAPATSPGDAAELPDADPDDELATRVHDYGSGPARAGDVDPTRVPGGQTEPQGAPALEPARQERAEPPAFTASSAPAAAAAPAPGAGAFPAPAGGEAAEPGPEDHAEEWEEEEEERPWYSRRETRRLLYLGAAAALLGALAIIPYPLYVTEPCTVLPLERVEVRSIVDGILVAILVNEGDFVHKGQVLARLDDRDVESALHQARADVDRLKANLEKMQRGAREEEIARARAAVSSRSRDVRFAQIEAKRKKDLFSQGVGSAEQRDNAERDLQVKRTELSQAEAELKLLQAGFRSEEVAVAEAELHRAQVELNYDEQKKVLLTITSSVDGQVMTPKFREQLGRKVAAGDTICEVADTRKVRGEIMVPEREIDVVKIGQPAVVKVQSYPLHPFAGRITFIASAVEERPDGRTLRVVTELDNQEGVLREGMTGYGEINTGKSRILWLAVRRVVRWVRVRFLI